MKSCFKTFKINQYGNGQFEQGQSLTEFVIVIFFIMPFLFVSYEVFRYFAFKNMISIFTQDISEQVSFNALDFYKKNYLFCSNTNTYNCIPCKNLFKDKCYGSHDINFYFKFKIKEFLRSSYFLGFHVKNFDILRKEPDILLKIKLNEDKNGVYTFIHAALPIYQSHFKDDFKKIYKCEDEKRNCFGQYDSHGGIHYSLKFKIKSYFPWQASSQIFFKGIQTKNPVYAVDILPRDNFIPSLSSFVFGSENEYQNSFLRVKKRVSYGK